MDVIILHQSTIPLKKFWKCQFIMNLRTANLFLGFFKWRSLFKKRNAASDKIWWFHYLQMSVVILLPKRFSNGHIMKFIFTIWDSGMSLVKRRSFKRKSPSLSFFPSSKDVLWPEAQDEDDTHEEVHHVTWQQRWCVRNKWPLRVAVHCSCLGTMLTYGCNSISELFKLGDMVNKLDLRLTLLPPLLNLFHGSVGFLHIWMTFLLNKPLLST